MSTPVFIALTWVSWPLAAAIYLWLTRKLSVPISVRQRPVSLDDHLKRLADEEFARWKADDELTDDQLVADVLRGYEEMEDTLTSFYRDLLEVQRLEDLFAIPSPKDQR